MLNLNKIKTSAEFLYLPQTTSTMDVAAEYLAKGAENFTTIFAEEQTAARGRRGKHWQHFKGCNLAYTTLIKGTLPPQTPLVTAVALRRALQPFIQEKITIKWPNDLKLNNKKLAGILVEQKQQGILVGVGVNVLPPHTSEIPADFPGIPLMAGGSIVQNITREDVMNAILQEFESAMKMFEINGWLPFASEYAKHCETIGQEISWHNGTEVLTGRAVSLTQDGTQAGSMELKTADGTVHTITAGEITAQAR